MTKETQKEIVRRLPSVDRLLGEASILEMEGNIPRSIMLRAARETLNQLRARILDGWIPQLDELSLDRIADQVQDLALQMNIPSLRKAINATGVILHTGLGRAVLPDAARRALSAVAAAHSTLEMDLDTGGRGSRVSHFSQTLAELCRAESGLAVNNNAAAVLLALNTLAHGKEVIVSRGQLIEIGGSFRLPDIMMRAGARLIEVGTTNRTRIGDYEAAITEETALILRVHTSNFRIVGFMEEAAIEELAELGHRYKIPVMEDVGSGALVDVSQFGLRGEPLVQGSIKAGADLVTFSGDKLLGGPQAGLVVGRRDIVTAMAENPLVRALRIDKFTVAALESTLKLYADPETLTAAVPTLKFIARPVSEIDRLAKRLARSIAQVVSGKVRVEVMDGLSEVGGGSLPGEDLPTKLVAITSSSADGATPMEIAARFRRAEPPVIGRVAEDRFLLDVRTVEASEILEIVQAARQIFGD